MAFPIPDVVLAAFPIGAVRSVEPVTAGLIHSTFKVEAEQGTFVLQRLHPVLSSVAVAEDFWNVTEHLASKGFPAPRCVRSVAGSVLVQDEEGKPWRMQTYLPGGVTHHRVETPEMAREAGAVYARFHAAMADFPHVFRSEKVLHDTPAIYAAFEEAVQAHEDSPLMAAVAEDVALIREELPALFLPDGLPVRVIHGDPKVSNILFDADGRAMALVDLDTCNRRPIAVELGDAFRSWCGVEEDRADNAFRLDIFEAGWKAYRAGAAFLTEEEIATVGRGIGLITLELSSRFLADYFNDTYFGWDASRYDSRRAHNLARVRGQLALYRDIRRAQEEIERIVRA